MATATKKPAVSSNAPRLKAAYQDKFVTELHKELGLDNVMQVPRLEKIV